MTLLYLNQEKEMNMRMLKAARKEEEEWRLKSRKLWLKGGDNNTGYFHKQNKSSLSFSIIKELNDSNGKKSKGMRQSRGILFNTSEISIQTVMRRIPYLRLIFS